MAQYRGSLKHKNWRPGGARGILCPEWTHRNADGRFAGDVDAHAWGDTEAHRLFTTSILHDGRRYATARGIAFVALPTNDGTWHGYPLPWLDVPNEVRRNFVDRGLVQRRQTQRRVNRQDIRWALDSDDA